MTDPSQDVLCCEIHLDPLDHVVLEFERGLDIVWINGRYRHLNLRVPKEV